MSEQIIPFSKLTKKEFTHLKKDAGCTTLKAFKATAAYQKQCRDEYVARGSSLEPCYECKNIARRLGLPV